MAQLTQWLWREEYWLPPGVTWEDMQETEDIHYPQPRDLLLSLPIALLLVTLRFLFERNVSVPLSKKLGLREKVRQKPSPNPVLEAFYTKRRKSPQQEELSSLAKQCDLHPRQVERWFRYRLNQDRPSLTKKFSEASWSGTFYVISFYAGLAILYNKSWFLDHRECWVGYPQQPLQPSIFGYYLVQFSFYCSLVITLPFDVKRKDFHEKIAHHMVTLLLISFSYCANYIRIGSLVMLLHDAPEHLIELTKMFNYLKWQKTSSTLFFAFSALFLFTWLVIFPYRIIYNTAYYFVELFQPFFGYYFLNALLIVLQLLHIFWSCLIFRMIYGFLIRGTVGKDVRSNSEDSEDEADLKAVHKNSLADLQSSHPLPGITKRAPLQLNSRSSPSSSHTKA